MATLREASREMEAIEFEKCLCWSLGVGEGATRIFGICQPEALAWFVMLRKQLMMQWRRGFDPSLPDLESLLWPPIDVKCTFVP